MVRNINHNKFFLSSNLKYLNCFHLIRHLYYIFIVTLPVLFNAANLVLHVVYIYFRCSFGKGQLNFVCRLYLFSLLFLKWVGLSIGPKLMKRILFIFIFLCSLP